MAKPIIRLFSLCILLFACGHEQAPLTPQEDLRDKQGSSGRRGDADSQDGQAESGEGSDSLGGSEDLALNRAIQQWSTWAPRCEGYPSKLNCEQGDMSLFNGLLCIAGLTESCMAVKASQDASGQFWRSPLRVDRDEENSFSRDMALGVLLYLFQSRDAAAAKAWLAWIDRNALCEAGTRSKCKLLRYRVCTDDTDGRCTISPGLWAMMGRVWASLDLSLHPEMMKWQNSGENALLKETQVAAPGYALHSKAVAALLYQKLDLALPFQAQLSTLLLQKQPENLFFRYLVDGKTSALLSELLARCPLDPPQSMSQWNWERDTQEKAWLQSMGWDCIFLGTLLKASGP